MSDAASGARFVLAVDVGGTFTDVIRHDTVTGAVEVAKTASTPPDFIDGMLAGIEAVGTPSGATSSSSRSAPPSPPTRSSCAPAPAPRW